MRRRGRLTMHDDLHHPGWARDRSADRHETRPVSVAQLRLFLAIIDERSLTSAARAEGISQSSASTALSQLERRLRGRLFERTPEGLVPTAAAQTLEWSAREAVARQRDMEDLAVRLAGAGDLRLAVSLIDRPSHLSMLPAVMKPFLDANPGSAIRAHLHPSDDGVLRSVARGETGVGLVSLDSSVQTPRLERLPVAEQPTVLLLPAERPRRSSLRELAADGPLPLIHTLGAPTDLVERFGRLGVDARCVFENTPPTLARSLVAEGLGAMLTTPLAARALERAGAWSLPAPDSLVLDASRISLTYRATTSSVLVAAFLTTARSVLAPSQ